MNLVDKNILVTRQPEQAAELIGEIERSGGHAVLFPTIKTDPPDSWDDADRVIERIAYYDGIVFTSANAVDYFMNRWVARDLAAALPRCTMYAIGSKTGERIKRHGLRVTALPESFSSASLSSMLAGGEVSGKRLLYPRGNLGTQDLPEALRRAGAFVDVVVVYKTVPAEPDGVDRLCRRILDGEIDVVTFASPSAAKNFVDIIPPAFVERLRKQATTAVIGPVTLEAARTLGFVPAIVAKESTARGLVRAIAEYFS